MFVGTMSLACEVLLENERVPGGNFAGCWGKGRQLDTVGQRGHVGKARGGIAGALKSCQSALVLTHPVQIMSQHDALLACGRGLIFSEVKRRCVRFAGAKCDDGQ